MSGSDTGNIHPKKGADGAMRKMIEEIDTSEDMIIISRKKFSEIGGMSATRKDVGVQCEYNNYKFPSDIPFVTLSRKSTYSTKAFILEEGCYLRLRDVKNAFGISEAEIYVDGNYVYLSEDRDGFVKMKFKHGSSYNLKDCHAK